MTQEERNLLLMWEQLLFFFVIVMFTYQEVKSLKNWRQRSQNSLLFLHLQYLY